jgi:hypothetical protein
VDVLLDVDVEAASHPLLYILKEPVWLSPSFFFRATDGQALRAQSASHTLLIVQRIQRIIFFERLDLVYE